MKHTHAFEPSTMTCACGMTAEEFVNGEAAHPGRPTSERLWDLLKRLYLMHR